MPRWTDESRVIHSQKLKGRIKTEEQRERMRAGKLAKKKSSVERFYLSTRTRSILGENHVPSDQELSALEEWFNYYSIEQTYDWMIQIARWISIEKFDFCHRRKKLKNKATPFEEKCILRYGNKEGMERFQAKKAVPTIWSKDYWIRLGLTREEATIKVSEIQKANCSKVITDKRKSSHVCVGYYLDRGFSADEARQIISSRQKRDLTYFINRYGDDEGYRKYQASIEKRKTTWKHKDRIEHGLKTIPKSLGTEGGLEISAIKLFLSQNELEGCKAMYGSPDRQFTVLIPNVGYRRYDLAIFDKNDKLLLIFEFHGPVHINFSNYDEVIRDELVWDDTGKTLPYNVTFGQVYDNDKAKRNFIESTYPDVIYVVAWLDDYKRKDLTFDTLSKRHSDRISKPIL